MNKKRLSLSCLLMLALSLPAVAGDIYKRVNADGVTEFSDRPMANSDRVEVDPNVVVTNPVQRPARPAASPAAGPAVQAAPAAARSRDRIADDDSYYVNQNRRDRAVRNEARERREQRSTRRQQDDEVVTDPNPGRAIRNAVRRR